MKDVFTYWGTKPVSLLGDSLLPIMILLFIENTEYRPSLRSLIKFERCCTAHQSPLRKKEGVFL